MADIRRLGFLRHLRGTPTVHVCHQRRGTTVHDGVGLAFWFRPLTAVISEVPVDDRELPLLFHARTADFQDVAVQAAVTFRISDPGLATRRLDFSIDPDTGAWRTTPLDQLAGLLAQLAQQHALDVLVGMSMAQALTDGVLAVRGAMTAGLLADERLASTGVSVIGVRVVALRPEPEVERALQTPTREQVQAAADRATFDRRAQAVESERAIAENELQSQIELARREQELVAQRGAAARRRAEEEAAAEKVTAAAAAKRTTVLADAEAGRLRVLGAAEGAAEGARLTAAASVDTAVLTALALRELAGQLPAIGSVTITPDLLSGLLAALPTTIAPEGATA